MPLLRFAGIFSDVHMLALMYAGELCYWVWSITSKKQDTDIVRATTSSDSKIKTVNSTPTATVSSSPVSREENTKTTELAESSKDTVNPSSGPIQLPTDITANSDNTQLSKIALPDDANAEERSCSSTSNVSPPASDSNSRLTSLEKNVQDLSMQDTELVASGGLNGTGVIMEPVPQRQLYSVMEHCQRADAVRNWKSRFNPLKRGQELLTKFVEMARGPLKAQGWNYARAVQLLVAMKKAQP